MKKVNAFGFKEVKPTIILVTMGKSGNPYMTKRIQGLIGFELKEDMFREILVSCSKNSLNMS